MKHVIATDAQQKRYDWLRDAGWEFHSNDGSLVLMKRNISSIIDNFQWIYCSITHDGKIANMDT